MNAKDLKKLINACKTKDRTSQKMLFYHVYDFGLNIARRYSSSLEEAEEIANDALYKMLVHIENYNEESPFLLWLRRIIINTGIDHYRKSKNKSNQIELLPSNKIRNLGSDKLDSEYLLEFLDRLSPQYKMVFVLHVLEGFSHKEIATRLNISNGTSKSNLSKARTNLKRMIIEFEQKENHGRQTVR